MVRAVGLPASTPYLVHHGMKATAWRAREGSLKLIIAGLLMPNCSVVSTHVLSPATRARARGVETAYREAAATIFAKDRKHGESEEIGEIGNGGAGEGGVGVGGVGTGVGNAWVGNEGRDELGGGREEAASSRKMDPVVSPSPPRLRRHSKPLVDERRLVFELGSLLTDERPEVSLREK